MKADTGVLEDDLFPGPLLEEGKRFKQSGGFRYQRERERTGILRPGRADAWTCMANHSVFAPQSDVVPTVGFDLDTSTGGLHNGALNGYGSKSNHQGTAGCSRSFHLPGFHFGVTIFLTHSHIWVWTHSDALERAKDAVVENGDEVTVHATGLIRDTKTKFWSTKDTEPRPRRFFLFFFVSIRTRTSSCSSSSIWVDLGGFGWLVCCLVSLWVGFPREEGKQPFWGGLSNIPVW